MKKSVILGAVGGLVTAVVVNAFLVTNKSATHETNTIKIDKVNKQKEAKSMLEPKVTFKKTDTYAEDHLMSLKHKAQTMTAIINGQKLTVNLPKSVRYEMVTNMSPSPAVAGTVTTYELKGSDSDLKRYNISFKDTDTERYTKINDRLYVKLADVTIYIMQEDYANYTADKPFTVGATEVNK